MKNDTRNPLETVTDNPAADLLALTADPLPREEAPQVPAGFVPRKLGTVFRGSRPAHVQVGLAPLVVNELRASGEYDATFGVAAPDKERVADALVLAVGWSQQLAKAQAWTEYVRMQEALAWKHAKQETEVLRDPFVIVAARDRKVAAQYPAIAQYFGVAKERGRRAAATKRAGRKARANAPQPVQEQRVDRPLVAAVAAPAPSIPSPIVNVMNGTPTRG